MSALATLGKRRHSILFPTQAGLINSTTHRQSQQVSLNYQGAPPPGKRTGRYIDRDDEGDVVDLHVPTKVFMRNARELSPSACLQDLGFELRKWPSSCYLPEFLHESTRVASTYYAEMVQLVKEACDAQHVYVFDHTIRESGATNLNATGDATSAAPVPRVHCDYTSTSAPRRLAQLGKEGITLDGHLLTECEVEALEQGRYAFINVWRSIDTAAPVLCNPLAVCAEASVQVSDRMLYELIFPDR